MTSTTTTSNDVDDVGDSDDNNDAQLWAEFQADRQDGGLDWGFSNPGNQVVFMDLTISIVGDRIRTTLFEKDLALYQYTPPSSAHPPGLLNGFVIGQVLHFHQLCTSISDVNDKMRLLHKRLMQRGYSEEKLFPYFLQGLRQPTTTTTKSMLTSLRMTSTMG